MSLLMGREKMKDVNTAEGIIPLGEFKARASTLLKELDGKDEPIVVTQNGRPAAVVLAPAAFEKMRERNKFLEAIAVGLADIEQGRVVEHEKVSQWLETWAQELENEIPNCE
jgi:prevent-host-death family protein